ncbi:MULTISPECIES: Hsp20/alpha crystallin family protein [unclassified Methanosarcina]|jgi:HSP20 family protein|uniref:Hsp20/alpha crystallin family protein n=1 Tax=unclassified Methanosarcina TaxID=2644672 RepID=UPI00062291D7|nr:MULTISPECIES: Hsp20/alpha crystallin family protein [unclassified Methanosarcina]KKG08077.1 heat-shock protein [Methanosarcina sp. 2.H.A.1B.4]KKH45183.1 heat-shock protein [Methanosarcina sp. 1.H.A.2.2]
MENPVPKIIKTPIIAMYHDDTHESLTIELELPDVMDEHITLVMHENSFYLKAYSETVEYLGSFFLDGPVDPEKAIAVNNKGMLTITVPYKEGFVCARYVPIE